MDIAQYLRPARVLAMCIDGTPRPTACPLPLHDPLYYALFYLVRETHPLTMDLPFGRFLDVLSSSSDADISDAVVEHLRPSEVGPRVWSMAVGLAMQRAGRMQTLQQEEDEVEGRQHVPIVAGMVPTGEDTVRVVSVVPDDQFGAAFGAAPGNGRVVVLPGTVHSEMLLDARTWQGIADVFFAAMAELVCVRE